MRTEALRALIKSHYNLIHRLEDVLDSTPARKRDFVCAEDIIINAVNQEFKTDCQKQSRQLKFVFARHAACYLLKRHTTMIWKDIAYATGNSDHSTAMASYKACVNLIATDDEYLGKIERIKKVLEDSKI
jgi:chromosomal replication initiation ATPase DnaA